MLTNYNCNYSYVKLYHTCPMQDKYKFIRKKWFRGKTVGVRYCVKHSVCTLLFNINH